MDTPTFDVIRGGFSKRLARANHANTWCYNMSPLKGTYYNTRWYSMSPLIYHVIYHYASFITFIYHFLQMSRSSPVPLSKACVSGGRTQQRATPGFEPAAKPSPPWLDPAPTTPLATTQVILATPLRLLWRQPRLPDAKGRFARASLLLGLFLGWTVLTMPTWLSLSFDQLQVITLWRQGVRAN